MLDVAIEKVGARRARSQPLVQPACGPGSMHWPTWRDGLAVRLPGYRLLFVIFGR